MGTAGRVSRAAQGELLTLLGDVPMKEVCCDGNGFAVVVVAAVNGAGGPNGLFATGAACRANGFAGFAVCLATAELAMVLALANGFGCDARTWGPSAIGFFCPGLMALLETAFDAEDCGGFDDHCGGDWKLGAPHVTLLFCCQALLLLAVANGLGC